MADSKPTPPQAWPQDAPHGSGVVQGHAFVQNLRRDHYELAIDTAPMLRLAAAFDELRPAI